MDGRNKDKGRKEGRGEWWTNDFTRRKYPNGRKEGRKDDDASSDDIGRSHHL
jgi:hypothetical protein